MALKLNENARRAKMEADRLRKHLRSRGHRTEIVEDVIQGFEESTKRHLAAKKAARTRKKNSRAHTKDLFDAGAGGGGQ